MIGNGKNKMHCMRKTESSYGPEKARQATHTQPPKANQNKSTPAPAAQLYSTKHLSVVISYYLSRFNFAQASIKTEAVNAGEPAKKFLSLLQK